MSRRQQHKTHYNFHNWMIEWDSVWKYWFSVPLGDLWNTAFNKFAIWLHFSFVIRSWFRITAQHMRWLIRVCLSLFSPLLLWEWDQGKETWDILYFKDTVLPTVKQNSAHLVELLLSFTVTLPWGFAEAPGLHTSQIKKGNSFMSQHSSVSSTSSVFTFNIVQNVKAYRGLVESQYILLHRSSSFVISASTWLMHFISI